MEADGEDGTDAWCFCAHSQNRHTQANGNTHAHATVQRRIRAQETRTQTNATEFRRLKPHMTVQERNHGLDAERHAPQSESDLIAAPMEFLAIIFEAKGDIGASHPRGSACGYQ